MGIRGELFTTQVSAENRTYFFNVKENTKGDVFLQVVESKASEGLGFDRHAVVVFEDEMRTFLQGLDKCIEFIEKNRKEKAKAKVKQLSDAKKPAEKKDGEKSRVKKVIKKKSR
ncbi:PUR family DNA/RNA-binding protein [Treponema sp. OMZ 799]|uniref:PUR family DNA/RNA-binding protein n=1 Tax=Treponema sp. OMZ 799 TaxID=2563668 RepID=UPI0020A38582|nr:PUR family DNA/RNA-binding protein [Treponema sp. OMZ 799]UTC78752.1 PUR family DNA/RNA-binding protein [Treponema sp. OMZ 799]